VEEGAAPVVAGDQALQDGGAGGGLALVPQPYHRGPVGARVGLVKGGVAGTLPPPSAGSRVTVVVAIVTRHHHDLPP
jgi:hypothetical protein